MTFKKKLLHIAVLSGVGALSTTANAALTNDGSMILGIDSGVASCVVGGTFPNCDFDAVQVDSGSYFNMDGGFASILTEGTGIVLGTTQPFDGNVPSAGDAYDGSGSNITAAWPFFGNLGTNFSVSNINANSDTEIDMSGWRVAWGEVAEINMGGGLTGTISCGTCNIGDTYTLDYSAVVPDGDPSGFGGVPYDLHLEGTINAIPVPAAVWLFGSGLLGLVGVARRRKAA